MRVLQVLLCAGMLAGCSADGGKSPSHPETAGIVRISGVPFQPQEGPRCGGASLAMVLGWTGLDVPPETLRERFALQGDPRAQLAQAAAFYGRLAYPVSGMAALVSELESGHPVLVVQNLGIETRPIWNCLVAIGFDSRQDTVIVHAGHQAGRPMAARTFERLWADSGYWGLVVLKSGDLPRAASLPGYLSAARALEQAGRYWEAVLAYDAALAVWPENSDTLMGLGGSLYSLGDPRGAAEAYRAAAVTAGDPTPARAALARVSAEIASREQPLSAIADHSAKAPPVDN